MRNECSKFYFHECTHTSPHVSTLNPLKLPSSSPQNYVHSCSKPFSGPQVDGRPAYAIQSCVSKLRWYSHSSNCYHAFRCMGDCWRTNSRRWRYDTSNRSKYCTMLLSNACHPFRPPNNTSSNKNGGIQLAIPTDVTTRWQNSSSRDLPWQLAKRDDTIYWPRHRAVSPMVTVTTLINLPTWYRLRGYSNWTRV